jgi:hypothetical protein
MKPGENLQGPRAVAAADASTTIVAEACSSRPCWGRPIRCFPLLIAVSLRQITSVWPTIRELSRVGASEQDALVRPHLRLARYPPQAGTVMVTALPDQVVFNEARNEGAGRRPEHVDAQADVWDLEDS